NVVYVTYTASDSRQYFLGVNGEQSGPYLEQDLIGRIQQGQVPADALVWFEGLPDWQPIQSIEFLNEAFQVAGGQGLAGEDPYAGYGYDSEAPTNHSEQVLTPAK